MIDTMLNLVFRCPHRRLTRPVAPVTKLGQPRSHSYVVCLDCGKQFEYDVTQMRIGKAIDHPHDTGVGPPNLPKPRKTKATYALLAAVPTAVLLGAVWKRAIRQRRFLAELCWAGRGVQATLRCWSRRCAAR